MSSSHLLKYWSSNASFAVFKRASIQKKLCEPINSTSEVDSNITENVEKINSVSVIQALSVT